MFKRLFSLFIASIVASGTVISASAASGQPFESGTAGSELFRIPAMITLDSGRVLVAADARYGHGTDSPANIDTVVRFSDDMGETWSEPDAINHFTDVEEDNEQTVVKASASFIDSAVAQDSTGKLYIITDACPAFIGSPTAGKSKNGYIDGKIVLCDKTTADGLESTKLDKTNYPYYIGEFVNGYAPVLKFSDGKGYKNYFVDREFNLYVSESNRFEKVIINTIGADGKLTENQTQANIFYAGSPIKIYPAFYFWLRTSTDGGESWSEPKILNNEIGSSGFTGVGPGRGFAYNFNGKERVMFTIYDNNKGTEYTSVIFTDDGGKTWSRGERASKVGFAGKSSESQMVELNNGVLRMYSRNTANRVSYCDSTDGGVTWSRYKLDRSLKYTSNCMVSFINYSGEIDGKKAIIAAFPATKKRKLGTVKIGLYGDNNKIDWAYSYNVTDSTEDLTYVYSCLSELENGRIALLYESAAADITYKVYSVDELKHHDKQPTGFDIFCKKILTFFKNLFK